MFAVPSALSTLREEGVIRCLVIPLTSGIRTGGVKLGMGNKMVEDQLVGGWHVLTQIHINGATS